MTKKIEKKIETDMNDLMREGKIRRKSIASASLNGNVTNFFFLKNNYNWVIVFES